MRTWSIVSTSEVSKIWPEVEPFITRACNASFDKQSSQDFLRIILGEQAQLWIGEREGEFEAAAITDVIQFPNKKYARITLGMGVNPTELLEFIEAFELWAKDIGCDGVQSNMRPGFAKQFHNANWKKTHVLMEKEF